MLITEPDISVHSGVYHIFEQELALFLVNPFALDLVIVVLRAVL